jgi:geranylgeranyl reductase family protein
MDYDVVIVGGGPIGCFVGGNISERGYSVVILEEHPEIGEPTHCSGLVSKDVISLSGVEEDVILNRIGGANIYAFDGTKLSFLGDDTYALVIDRVLFDRKIAEKAEKKGAEILKGARAVGAEREDNKIIVKYTKDKEEFHIRSSILIGADGAYSSVARWFGLPFPSEIIYGFQVEGELSCNNLAQVNVMIDNETSPGWFSWIIPVKENYARIGLGINVRENPRKYLDKLCKKWELLNTFSEDNIKKVMGGLIPLGLIGRSYTDNVILVGDAAAQLKPLSGGGLYLGLLAGEICSDVVLDGLEKKDFSSSMLSKYHKLWMKSVGKEIRLGLRLRRIFLGLSDEEKAELLEILDNQEAKSIILSAGHIDHPWKVAYKLMTHIKAPLMVRMLKLAFS